MTFSIVIDSRDKISGTNNSCLFNVNWNILPDNIKYWRLTYSFYTTTSFYKDSVSAGNAITYTASNGFITTNLFTPLSNQSNNSQTKILGFWVKQMNPTNITAHPYLTYLYSSIENTSAPLTILRPSNQNIQINIYNLFNNSLVVDTAHDGTQQADMSAWVLNLNFEPVLYPDTE